MQLHHVQGDILFVRVGGVVPEGARIRPDGIVVRGETTGHAHRVVGDATVFEVADRLLIEVTGTAEVVHEDHPVVALDPGMWQVTRQHTYEAGDIRRMMD